MTDQERTRCLRRLRFPPDLERAFQEDYYARYRRALRAFQVVSVLLCAAEIVDALHRQVPAAGVYLLYLPTIGSACVGLALTFTRGFWRWWQLFVILGLAFAPIEWASLAWVISDSPVRPDPTGRLFDYSRAVLMLMLISFSCLRLQSRWMAVLQTGQVAVSLWAALSYLSVPRGAILTEYLWVIVVCLGMILFAACLLEYWQRSAFLANHLLEQERAKSENLLVNVLPDSIAQRLKHSPERVADDHAEASVLFADVVDFTPFCAERSAGEVVAFLDEVFSRFDALVEKHGLEKIKTVGDCYMVVSGAPTPRPDHLEALARFALELEQEARRLGAEMGLPLRFRIGLHAGPLVAGVLGQRRLLWDVFGDTVNTASRLESHGTAGRIQVSRAVADRLRNRFRFSPTGLVEVKGKGTIETCFLEGDLAGT